MQKCRLLRLFFASVVQESRLQEIARLGLSTSGTPATVEIFLTKFEVWILLWNGFCPGGNDALNRLVFVPARIYAHALVVEPRESSTADIAPLHRTVAVIEKNSVARAERWGPAHTECNTDDATCNRARDSAPEGEQLVSRGSAAGHRG